MGTFIRMLVMVLFLALAPAPGAFARGGVIAPFPNLTVLDIGTRKEFSLTV